MEKKAIYPLLLLIVILALLSFSFSKFQNPFPEESLIQPTELLKLIDSKSAASKPLILNVGSMELIKTAETGGLGSMQEGMEKFIAKVRNVDKTKMIVLYCGCCKLDHCPNVKPPYDYLKEQGFNNVKILNLTTGIYEDWISKGYPMNK
jgi:hypothetical protein